MRSKPLLRSPLSCEICILAGGLSRRMGLEKAALRLGSRTMLSQIRNVARDTGLPVRVICRDLVSRCGPVGGVYTGLKTTAAGSVLFLSCDMPFITPDLLQRLLQRKALATFVANPQNQLGFPFLLRQACLPIVDAQIRSRDYSLQALAAALRAGVLRLPARLQSQLFNVNTPGDWELARQKWSPS